MTLIIAYSNGFYPFGMLDFNPSCSFLNHLLGLHTSIAMRSDDELTSFIEYAVLGHAASGFGLDWIPVIIIVVEADEVS